MNNGDNENKKKIKIILIGNGQVGKTSLINVYDGKKFTDKMLQSVCSHYIKKELIINEETYNIHLWDTAGQERFRSVNKIYIKGSNIVIFVYDITNKISFMDIKDFWVEYVDKIIGKDNIIMGILGNKIDLIDKSQVDKEEVEKYVKEIGAFFAESSAKVDPDSFAVFINELLNEYISKNNNFPENNNSLSFNIDDEKKQKKSRESCC